MINIFRVNSCEGSSGLTIRIPRTPSERTFSSRATMSDGPSPTPFQKRTRPIVKSRSLTTSIDKLVGDQQYRPSSVCSSSRYFPRSSRSPSTNSVRERNEVKAHARITETNNRKETRSVTEESTSSSNSKDDCGACTRTRCQNSREIVNNIRSPDTTNARCITEKSIRGQRKKPTGKHPLDNFPKRNGFPVFNSCMSLFQVQENLRRGELIEGVLLINPKKYEDAYITAPAMLGRGDGHLYWRDI